MLHSFIEVLEKLGLSGQLNGAALFQILDSDGDGLMQTQELVCGFGHAQLFFGLVALCLGMYTLCTTISDHLASPIPRRRSCNFQGAPSCAVSLGIDPEAAGHKAGPLTTGPFCAGLGTRPSRALLICEPTPGLWIRIVPGWGWKWGGRGGVRGHVPG